MLAIDVNEIYKLKEAVLDAQMELDRLQNIVKSLTKEERQIYDKMPIF